MMQEHVQRRAVEVRKCLEHKFDEEQLRELGKGLRLEQRRLRGDLTAPHKSLPGGAVKGREEMAPNGTRGGSGWRFSKQFFPARVVRPWDELPREWWSRCLWECSGGVWMWPLGTGFGVLLLLLGWHWVILEGSSSLDDPGILPILAGILCVGQNSFPVMDGLRR